MTIRHMKDTPTLLIIREIQKEKEVLPHTCQNIYYQKYLQISSVGEDMEKRKLLYLFGGSVKWCTRYGFPKS